MSQKKNSRSPGICRKCSAGPESIIYDYVLKGWLCTVCKKFIRDYDYRSKQRRKRKPKTSRRQTLNTRHVLLNFGTHRDKLLTDLPLGYLKFMIPKMEGKSTWDRWYRLFKSEIKRRKEFSNNGKA